MRIIPENFDFYASKDGESKDKLLLSLSGYNENLSKIPLANEFKYNTESIFGILNEVVEKYDNLSRIFKKPQSLLCILEVIGKLMKMCMRHHKPYRILELGSEQGLLGYFLTFVAREFNNENSVHCVSGYLPNQEWYSLLQEYGDAAENLNLHVTPLQTLSLQENFFDFCVVNHSENFSSADEVLKNAIRLLNVGGILVVVSDTVTEQTISHEQKIAAYGQTDEANINLQKDEMKFLLQDVKKRFAKIGNLTKEELCRMVKDLTYLEKLAVKLFADAEYADLKCKINKDKENVLNILYAPNQELKDLFVSKEFYINT